LRPPPCSTAKHSHGNRPKTITTNGGEAQLDAKVNNIIETSKATMQLIIVNGDTNILKRYQNDTKFEMIPN
jgi:hypothetical protein